MHPDQEPYVKAFNLPEHLDEIAVEKHLAQYLEALGVKRIITRLRAGWTLEEHPALEKYANEVLKKLKGALDEFDALGARARRAALDARNALETLDEKRARNALATVAARVADSTDDRIGPLQGVDVGDICFDAARAALVAGASILTSDELDALAHRAASTAHAASTDPGTPADRAARAAVKAFELRTSRAELARRATDNAIHCIHARHAAAALVAIKKSNQRFTTVPDPYAWLIDSVAGIGRFSSLALNVRDARTAYHSHEALRRFAAGCVHSQFDHRLDLSAIAGHWFLAKTDTVKAWSRPLFEAYKAGALIIHWTEDTLFWVAKPRLYVEGTRETTQRLHRSDGPAVESDVENLYYLNGVLVPDFVVTRPERITVDHIQREENAEVRRVMIERYGPSRYLCDSNAEVISQDDFGTLYRAPVEDDEPLVMVRVVNSTAGPDGSRKDYFLRVPPGMKRAREAVAWTFGLKEMEYKPDVQT